MKVRLILIAAFVIAASIGLSFISRSESSLQRLQDDAVHEYSVGNHPVIIETLSTSISGEDGDAKIIVTSVGERTTIDAWFTYDLYMDIGPGYVSWEELDAHQGRDLLIWTHADIRTLTAQQFVSSSDGRLHTLDAPLNKPK